MLLVFEFYIFILLETFLSFIFIFLAMFPGMNTTWLFGEGSLMTKSVYFNVMEK